MLYNKFYTVKLEWRPTMNEINWKREPMAVMLANIKRDGHCPYARACGKNSSKKRAGDDQGLWNGNRNEAWYAHGETGERRKRRFQVRRRRENQGAFTGRLILLLQWMPYSFFKHRDGGARKFVWDDAPGSLTEYSG